MDLLTIFEYFLAALFLPFFGQLVEYAAGAGDPLWVALTKWLVMMLPLLAIIWAYWVTIVGLVSTIIRADRKAFLTTLMIAWWDLGHAILSYWAGFFKFALRLVYTILLTLRLVIVSLVFLVRDLLMIPIQVATQVGDKVVNRGVPWIAVALTLFWCLLESVIFTYVMTPLVLDTLANMTGAGLTEQFVRIPLFMFMLFIVLGSYAVLSTWTQALQTKNVGAIVKIGAIELVAMFVEVVFLYREFVDALVPWFAQHSAGGFELGIFGTLAIASITWLGVRALSWFLFASAGTPTIMAVIQGQGINMREAPGDPRPRMALTFSNLFMERLKADEVWLRAQIDELTNAFVLPPLQLVACAINFAAILLTTKPLFELPFHDLSTLKEARITLHKHNRMKPA